MSTRRERVRIGRARRRDLAAVVRLLAAQMDEHAIAIRHAALRRTVRGWLDDPRRGRLVLAWRDGDPVGIAALSFVYPIEHGGRSAWLEELYVVPACRARGLGARLLRATVAEARRCRVVAIDLEVQAGHERAARLYRRAGFQAVPRRRFVRVLAPARGGDRLPPRAGVGPPPYGQAIGRSAPAATKRAASSSRTDAGGKSAQ